MNYYEPLVYQIPAEEDGWILKTILQKRMFISRSLLSRLKQTEQGIMLNGERVYISVRVTVGDRVEVRMEEETSTDIVPQHIPLNIIHEDEHLLILNKPTGIIVHPTHGHYMNTLANGVVYYWQQSGQNVRFRPIHRLDQETSGVLAIAKNPYVHQWVSEQMIAQQTKKEYMAIVYGVVETDRGTIDAPIDRDPESPHLRIVLETGYPSVTHYEVVQRYKAVTQVRLWLDTGRTHQIRVHMRSIGHPLIGDKLYFTDVTGSELIPADPSITMERHALHAEKLGFIHPGTKQWIEYTALLPEDMLDFLAKQLKLDKE
ncbi:MAG: RluA family pseudouridine synthase [Paenibacillaceae bacterium]